MFSAREEYITARQYYQNLKRPTRTPHDQANIDLENLIDITSMPTHHQSVPPRQRITSSRMSRVSRDFDSDGDVISYPNTVGSSKGVNCYGCNYSDVAKDYQFFSYTGDELLDKEHPKYISLIHQACGSDDELTMKAILIGFAVQCPEHIKHMKVFIGNWEG